MKWQASSLVAIACLLLIAGVFHWHAWNARSSWSATVDETCYLRCAANTLALQRLDPQLVAFGIAPLPILVQWLPAVRWEVSSPQHNYWQGSMRDPPQIAAARFLTSAVVGSGLLATVFTWMTLRRGLFWGATTTLLMASSPHVIAHASLATTDALAAWMWIVCLASYTWALKRLSAPAPWETNKGYAFETNHALAGLACGTAISAKYSGVGLVVVWLLLWTGACWQKLAAIDRRSIWAGALRDWLPGLSIFLTVTVISCWGWHGFAWAITLQDESPARKPSIITHGQSRWLCSQP